MRLSRYYQENLFSSTSFIDKILLSWQHMSKFRTSNMSGPELPYKISFSEEALACLRKITKLIDDLRDKLRLDLNEMRLHRNKVNQQNQTILQNFKLQMQPQAVPVYDLFISKLTYQKILVSSDLGPDLDPVQEIARVFLEPPNHYPHKSLLRTQTRFSLHLVSPGYDTFTILSRKCIFLCILYWQDPIVTTTHEQTFEFLRCQAQNFLTKSLYQKRNLIV